MLPPADLASVLPTLPTHSLTGYGFRVVQFRHLVSSPAPQRHRVLYALAAPAVGARFTPRGGMSTIYFAEDQETAFAEANPIHALIHRLDPALAPPTSIGVYMSLHYQLEAVLDLTDPKVQKALQTSRTELRDGWRLAQSRGGLAVTQQLGQAIYDCGNIEAVFYESARVDNHLCFAVFPDRLAAPGFLEVYDPDGNFPERLP